MLFEFHDIQQNTDEWFNLRAKKITGSKFNIVMANLGKVFGEPAKKYAVNIAIEQITGIPLSSDFTNSHMERGHEQEPIARELYEQETFCEVTNGGFFEMGSVGVSPDGLVDNNGLIEIKSVIPSVHYASIRKQGIPSAYKWQCIGNLKYTGRAWLDFVSFCADFPIGRQLFIHRIYKKHLESEFDTMYERFKEFEALIEKSKVEILSSRYDNY